MTSVVEICRLNKYRAHEICIMEQLDYAKKNKTEALFFDKNMSKAFDFQV